MGLPVLKRSQFLEDYAGIVLTIQEADPMAAHRFCDEIEAAVQLISTHPEIARQSWFPESARDGESGRCGGIRTT